MSHRKWLMMACWLISLITAAPLLAADAMDEGISIEVVSFGVEPGAAVNGQAVPDGSGKQSPLFAASDAVGLPEALGIALSELLAEEVNFHRDLVRGYRCTMVYEMSFNNGIPQAGRILAVEFSNAERHLEVFLYQGDPTYQGYYDAKGMDVNKSLRIVDPLREPGAARLVSADLLRVFRRSPLEFSRITSVPSTLRYHPILKEWRAHRGTDYGAPIGTRVMATADGVISFVGVKGGYGNLVEIRHFNRFITRYAHLSRFADKLAAGQSVRKGQMIGEVGMTGLATGPHLHYEMLSARGAIMHTPAQFAIKRLPASHRAAFAEQVAHYRHKLGFAKQVAMIRLE